MRIQGIPRSLALTVTVILIVLYVPFHNRYRIEHIDDAWSFSWAYGYWNEGDVYDSVFGYLDGDGGTSVFGRTYALIYGAWGLATSWSRPAGYLLSTLLLFGVAALWRKNLLILGYTPSIAMCFVLIMLLMEAYYGMAHRLRSDALVLFLSTLSLTLHLCKRPFFSAISLCVAIETHPYGLVGLFYILSATLSELLNTAKENRRFTAVAASRFILGGLLGLGYYMALHFKWIGGLLEISNRIGGNPIFKYFFEHRYSWRHWPELVIVIAGIFMFIIRKEYRNDKFIPIFICMMLLFSILLPRGNHQYIVFLYPPFILLLLYLSANLNLLPVFIAGFLLFQIPQYAWLFWSQRNFSWPDYVERLREVIPENEDATIYGPSSAWFALYDRNYKAYGYFRRANTAQLPEKMYVIENGNMEREGGIADLQNIEQYYEKQRKEEWFEPGHSRYLISYWELEQPGKDANGNDDSE